ncbi:MAG: DUF6573 family protein [Bryobacteraceae bacterium]|nr:DUF6573 family protein [Bryobacteraceae bacterium]
MNTDNGSEEFELIHAYTRKQALEDGVLVDLGALASEAGFRWPVAVTRTVYDGILVPPKAVEQEGQSFTGRAWDLLTVLRLEARRTGGGREVRFAPLFVSRPGEPPKAVPLKAVSGPGDDGEPVITVMLPDED